MKKSTKSANYRYAKAHELVFKNMVDFDKTSDTYQVRSISDPDLVHIISKKAKELECDCLGYSFNLKCSHCVAVRVFQRTAKK